MQDDLQMELSRADAWLRERGVERTLETLHKDASEFPQCLPQLLELLERPSSLRIRNLIARAIIHRKPNIVQKRRAFEVFLTILKERVGQYDVLLSGMVLNPMVFFVTPERVRDIGEMTLDSRYGLIRAELTVLLRQIGNADAVAYLLRAARDPVTASLALDGLARLKVPEALPLCEEALENPEVPQPHKHAIKATYSKLKRQVAKRVDAPTHVTKDAVPEELEEWSLNLDSEDLPKVLRSVQKCVEAGFAKAEISEVICGADRLSPELCVRFRFVVKHSGKEAPLWLEIFCDDENALELYLFSDAGLIRRVEGEIENVLR